jgi:hypothetical protein
MSHLPTTNDPLPPPPEPSTDRGRRPLVVGLAIGVAVVLAVGIAGFAITRSDPAEARPLALSFEQGQEQTYGIHQTMDGRVSSDLVGDQRIEMDLSQTVTWRVLSVDGDGVATIEVTVTDLSGTLNGVDIPPATGVPPVEIVIAPDGRVLEAGGLSLGGAGQTQGFGFPGMGQLTPLLPDEGEEVAVGDSWDKEFSQPFPFGEGTIEFTASSTYVRDDTVDGRPVAVIETDLTVPLDFTLRFSDLIDALGSELAGTTGAADLDALGDATIDYGGSGAFTQTSFVDLDAHELLRSRSEGEFDLSMKFSGIPGVGQVAEMSFTGSFTQELELR